MISAIAARYAEALVDVVFAPGSSLDPQAVTAQMRSFVELDSADLHAVLLSPAVAPSKKRSVVGKLAASMGMAPQVRNFLYVIIDHRRVGELSSICDSFETLVDQRRGIQRADISTAERLSESQKETLEAALARLTGKQIRPQYQVDPALIGGVVARIGSTVYDGSVRGQLEGLKKRLIAGS